MQWSPDLSLADCCSLAYSHPAVRWLLGDSLHPGGLDLTRRLVEELGLGPDSQVLDAGCGPGTSTVFLAETFGCTVEGLTLEEHAVAAAVELADRRGVAGRTSFARGDIDAIDTAPERFDAVVMECVLSILLDKPGSLRRLAGVLKPGARLGMTDVTVTGPLPPELEGRLASVGCVGDALSLASYRHMVEAAGLTIEQTEDLPEIASAFLKAIDGKLRMAELGSKLKLVPVDPDLVTRARGYVGEAQRLVGEGTLSYGLVIARKP